MKKFEPYDLKELWDNIETIDFDEPLMNFSHSNSSKTQVEQNWAQISHQVFNKSENISARKSQQHST